jgi:chromosome segregation ATPase
MNKFMLPLNLQFFAEDGGAGAGGGQTDPNQQTDPNNAGGQNQDPQGQGSNNKTDGQSGNDGSQNQQQNEHFIPKTRFDEVNNKLKELQDQIAEANKQKEQEELEAKKKKGEFENLYTEASQELENTKTQFEQTSQRVEQLEGIIQTLVDAEMEAVPEAMRDLVPENFTPEQKLSWITQAKQKGLFGTQQNSKENEELGGATNNQQQTQPDISKMSATELLRSAYGKK